MNPQKVKDFKGENSDIFYLGWTVRPDILGQIFRLLLFFRVWKCDNLVFSNYLKINKNNFSEINNYD